MTAPVISSREHGFQPNPAITPLIDKAKSAFSETPSTLSLQLVNQGLPPCGEQNCTPKLQAAPQCPRRGGTHGPVEAAPFTEVVLEGSLSRHPRLQRSQPAQKNPNPFCSRYRSVSGSALNISLPHFINARKEREQQPPTGSEKEQQFLWEVLIRSQAVTFPPSMLKTLV